MVGSRESAEVIVVGAGIVGVSAALTLAEHGVDVVVLDRGQVAGEASGLNAGMIGGGGWGDSPTVDVALKMGSREFFAELSEARGRDIALDCTGSLTMIATDAEWAWAQGFIAADTQAGRSLQLVDADRLLDLEPQAEPALLGAILDPLGARAEPVAATEAIAAEARTAGASIFERRAVDGLREARSGGWEVATSDGSLGADVVVIAAGPWCADLLAPLGCEVPIVPVRGQMWATGPQPPMLHHAIAAVESAMAWDGEAPTPDQPPALTHHNGRRLTRHLYGRQRPNGEVVFGGDRVLTDDRTVDAEGIDVNRGQAAAIIPALGRTTVARTWSGLMPFPLDGRPLIGPVAERPGLFIAGGLASSGFGRGPMTGRLVAESVLGRQSAFDCSPVDPTGRIDVSSRG